MESARVMSAVNRNNKTDDLDDTLPIELLDCVDTTSNENWLTKGIHFPGISCAPTLHIKERVTRTDSSAFNPPLSSTRYKSDGSSSECSDASTTAECGSNYEDEIASTDSEKNSNDHFIPPLFPAASMEFQPLRCSTAVTTSELVSLPTPRSTNNFQIRVDTSEMTSLRQKQKQEIQRTESIEFNPLRCSTGLTAEDAALKAGVRPTSPEEFYTANSFGANTGTDIARDDDTHFTTALGVTQGNSCVEEKSDRRPAENAESPCVLVSSDPVTQSAADLDDDLSILMQCHLKIRNGRHIISKFQAKPQIEFSVLKDSPYGTATVPQAFKTKTALTEGKNKIPASKPYLNQNQQNSNQGNQQPRPCGGLSSKPLVRDSRIKKLHEEEQTNFVSPSPSAIPTVSKLIGRTDLPKGTLNRGSSPSGLNGRYSPVPVDESRIQRALDNLTSTNLQKVASALVTLDYARSAHLCETLVERRLIDRIYDFLTKMNRSLAHQGACVHATSILLDLAKYHYSTESTWQNGNRVGLLFNLLSIWVSKDNSIFLNCATLLWVFCQDKTRANFIRRFVTTQNKLLEKISAKLSTKILRTGSKVPTLEPSWTNSGVLRTFENPCSAFSGLSTALKKVTPRIK